MKNLKKLLIAGGIASVAFTACSIVDEYDQELVDRYEQAVQDEKDSVKQAEQDRKDSIANLDSATCPETFTDTRDENVYDIVRIYDPEVDSKARCWFKQNLKYDAKDDSRCLDDEKRNCKTYGRLYLGSAIKKGVCPEGTRVSSMEDWEHLLKVVDPDENSSYILKDAEEWIASGTASKATDKYGFSAMPGGFYDDDEEEYTEEFHNDGHWWVYSKDSFKYVRMSAEDNFYDFKTIDAYNSEGIGLSVRCVLESNHSIEADTSSSEGGDESSSSAGNGEAKSSSSEGSSDDESSSSEEVDPEDVIVPQNNVDIDGVSQKGPFIKGATVSVFELENGRNLSPKGTAFPTTISTDDGKFKLTNLKLKSQFVYLLAEGYYRNEVTGEGSTAPITLKAVSDLTKMKTINVNLLTHLEFYRAEYLVVNKGVRVSKAKIQADKEIFKNFYIDASEFKAAEKLSVVGSSDEDAALLALSVIFQGGFKEAELTDVLSTFSDEIKETGEWKNDSLKTKLADWVANTEFKDHFAGIRENVKKWNLGEPGNFEKYLTNFWLTVYGMDPCTSADEGKITSTENKYSSNTKDSLARFICKSGNWELATDLEKDTEGWTSGKDGQVKNGKVNTDSVYVYDGAAWRKGNVLDSTLGIGACYTKSNRDLKKSEVDSKWYLCDLDSLSWVETHRLNSYFARFTPDDKVAFLNATKTDVVNDTMIDPRDGHVYRTVKIKFFNTDLDVFDDDSLVWMAENLNYDPKPTDKAYGQSWCYGDLDYNCEIAGRLYSWTGAMNMDPAYLDAKVSGKYTVGYYGGTPTEDDEAGVVDNLWYHQGICPDGWVVPGGPITQMVFQDIVETYGEEFKTSFEGVWDKANNGTGFSVIPTGYRIADGTYSDAGTSFNMWISENDAGKATLLSVSDENSYDYVDAAKRSGAAVRCIKLPEP